MSKDDLSLSNKNQLDTASLPHASQDSSGKSDNRAGSTASLVDKRPERNETSSPETSAPNPAMSRYLEEYDRYHSFLIQGNQAEGEVEDDPEGDSKVADRGGDGPYIDEEQRESGRLRQDEECTSGAEVREHSVESSG